MNSLPCSIFRSLLLPAVAACLVWGAAFPAATFAEEPPKVEPQKEEKFNLGKNLEKKGNVLDYVFGMPPPMATDRALLVVGAFLDENGNDRKDKEEDWLEGEITCILDGVDYTVPAFIPGLKPEQRYQLHCSGAGFQPRDESRTVFFQRRGEIMQIELACRESGKKTVSQEDRSLSLSLQDGELNVPPKDPEPGSDTPKN